MRQEEIPDIKTAKMYEVMIERAKRFIAKFEDSPSPFHQRLVKQNRERVAELEAFLLEHAGRDERLDVL